MIGQKGFALIHLVVAFPLFAGIIGTTGAGSVVLSRFRTSLGTCREGLLAAVAPLEKAVVRLQRMNPQALVLAQKELGIRARLAGCGAVPITCAEPAAQLARLMIRMKKFNDTRNALKLQAEVVARDYQLQLERKLRIQGNQVLQRGLPAKLNFDFTPALVNTPAWVMGPQFEHRTAIRQSFEFQPLRHIPAWLAGLLGPNFRWNALNAHCAATVKNRSGNPYRSLTAARPSWSSAL